MVNSKIDGESPVHILKKWLEDAEKTEINDPNAMTLSTVDENGMPDSRIVLLKGIDTVKQTIAFFTNYDSAKGLQLQAKPFAAITIHWKSLRRQIRARGGVAKVSPEQSDLYFYSRSYDSQISAAASKQSSVLTDREELMQRVRALKQEFPSTVPRPTNWGGYALTPTEFEFWEDGAHRLHNRQKWTKSESGIWSIETLYP
jgi:pyridoxamine 5'-phosphate oxidase